MRLLLLLLVGLRGRLLVLILQAALGVWTLRVRLSGVHLVAARILLCAVDLLRLVLRWCLPGRAVADRR